jgi:two-component system, NarL family, sensor histidine kinase EvgS
VETANDGAAALSRWRADAAAFDLILTDCSMPVMNGEELARLIRGDEAARAGRAGAARGAIPIVGVTADARPEAAAQAVVAGMTMCLAKPVGFDALRRALVLAMRSNGLATAARSSSERPAPRVPEVAQAFDPALVDTFGAEAATLVETMQTANAQDLAEARDAMDACDYARLRETAHRMKGAAFVIGATPFASACAALQVACQTALDDDRNGEEDEHIAAAFRVFIDEGAALDAALAQRAI